MDELRPRHAGIVIEEVVCVQNGVAKVFIESSVKPVCAGLCSEGNHAPGELAILRIDYAGLHAELLHGILRKHVGDRVTLKDVDRCTIHVSGLLVGQAAGDGVVAEPVRIRKGAAVGIVARRSAGAALRDDARRQGNQVHGVAAV